MCIQLVFIQFNSIFSSARFKSTFIFCQQFCSFFIYFMELFVLFARLKRTGKEEENRKIFTISSTFWRLVFLIVDFLRAMQKYEHQATWGVDERRLWEIMKFWWNIDVLGVSKKGINRNKKKSAIKSIEFWHRMEHTGLYILRMDRKWLKGFWIIFW